MKYTDIMTSTDEKCVFLHRCSREQSKNILKEGLASGANLLSTATFQPRNLAEAENLYKKAKGYGDTVIVLQIPVELWNIARRKARGEEVLTNEIGYFNLSAKDFAVKPEFVTGWIDRKNNKYHLNNFSNKGYIKKNKTIEEMFD